MQTPLGKHNPDQIKSSTDAWENFFRTCKEYAALARQRRTTKIDEQQVADLTESDTGIVLDGQAVEGRAKLSSSYHSVPEENPPFP